VITLEEHKYLKFVLTIFLAYSIIYLITINQSSYVVSQYKTQRTIENIEEFENLIENGQIIDYKSYLYTQEEKASPLNKFIIGISDEVNKITKDLLKGFSKLVFDSLN